MQTKSRKPRRALMECLESRVLMAGDVSVALEGQLLKVEGDNLGNQIVVAQNAAGNVTVSGQNGTLVNGLSSIRLINPQLNAIEVRMEGGDDSVTLRGVQTANDLFVNLGSGNDRLVTAAAAPVTVGANASFEGGEGNDLFRLANLTVREDLSIDGGIGALTANLSDVVVDKGLTVIGDDASDSVVLVRGSVGDGLSVETKGGADIVTLVDLLAYSVQVNTDSNLAGVDRVTLERVTTQEDLGVFTGDGNDVVRLTDVTSGKSLTVSTDGGDDRVIATRVAAAHDAVFEGGAGFDILDDLGIFGGVKKDIKEFELVR